VISGHAAPTFAAPLFKKCQLTSENKQTIEHQARHYPGPLTVNMIVNL